jgi:hypothetical protein
VVFEWPYLCNCSMRNHSSKEREAMMGMSNCAVIDGRCEVGKRLCVAWLKVMVSNNWSVKPKLMHYVLYSKPIIQLMK